MESSSRGGNKELGREEDRRVYTTFVSVQRHDTPILLWNHRKPLAGYPAAQMLPNHPDCPSSTSFGVCPSALSLKHSPKRMHFPECNPLTLTLSFQPRRSNCQDYSSGRHRYAIIIHAHQDSPVSFSPPSCLSSLLLRRLPIHLAVNFC